MKYLIVLALFSYTMICNAESSDSEMIKLANSRYQQSLIKLAEQTKICTQKSKTNKLPIDSIKQLNILSEELITAISYYYLKSGTDCEKAATQELLMNSTLLLLLDNQSQLMVDTSNQLTLNSYKLQLESEVEFNKLPLKTKEKLATITEFNQPFDPIDVKKQLITPKN